MRALFVSGTSAYPTEGDAVATAKKPAAKKPAAKKPAAKRISALEKLLNDTEQILKDQNALNARIKKINARYLKVDPSKDQKAANSLAKVSTMLRNLNDQAELFSATTQGDPWEWVLNLMKQIVAAEKKGDEDLAEELESKLGYENDVDQQVIDDWVQLDKFRKEGLGGYRQEQWVALTQDQFFEMMDDLRIELPYPDASENAYW